LKQIGVAMHNYHGTYRTFPPALGNWYDFGGWLSTILPYIEQDTAYNNQAYWNPIAVYTCPSDPRDAAVSANNNGFGLTWYLGVMGSVGLWDNPPDASTWGIMETVTYTGVGIAQITDGTSQTLMVGERPPSADLFWGWWSFFEYDTLLPTQNYYDPYGGCPLPGVYGPGNVNDVCASTHFWSLHNGGANWLYGDGSVRYLPYTAAPITIPQATMAGVVDDSSF
jgi:prepilin-type processing-associated H-X9-DG protein